MRLSKHAIIRGKERFELEEESLREIALQAFYLGIEIKDMPPEFKRTKRAMERIHESSTGHGEKNVLFFDNKIFVFKGEVLVTITKADKRDLK